MPPSGPPSPSSSSSSSYFSSSCLCLSLCQKSRRFKAKREGTDCSSRPIKLAGKVIIQEISCLLPVHKALGEGYMSVQGTAQGTLFALEQSAGLH